MSGLAASLAYQGIAAIARAIVAGLSSDPQVDVSAAKAIVAICEGELDLYERRAKEVRDAETDPG